MSHTNAAHSVKGTVVGGETISKLQLENRSLKEKCAILEDQLHRYTEGVKSVLIETDPLIANKVCILILWMNCCISSVDSPGQKAVRCF